jgi:hypothetical protein
LACGYDAHGAGNSDASPLNSYLPRAATQPGRLTVSDTTAIGDAWREQLPVNEANYRLLLRGTERSLLLENTRVHTASSFALHGTPNKVRPLSRSNSTSSIIGRRWPHGGA